MIREPHRGSNYVCHNRLFVETARAILPRKDHAPDPNANTNPNPCHGDVDIVTRSQARGCPTHYTRDRVESKPYPEDARKGHKL